MRNKVLNYNNRYYLLKSPKDHSLSAREDYRACLLAKGYDLVLVENDCPLEPNFVIVEDLPEGVKPDELRRLN